MTSIQELEPLQPGEGYACPHCTRVMYPKLNYHRDKWNCYRCNKAFEVPLIKELNQSYTGRKKRVIPEKYIFNRKQIIQLLRDKTRNPYVPRRYLQYYALIAFLWLTGARVSEIVGVKDRVTRKYKVEPVRKHQIETTIMYDRKVWRVKNMPVLKHKLPKATNFEGEMVSNYKLRTVSVLYEDEREIISYIENWTKHLKSEDDIVFKMSSAWAWYICKDFNNSFCHFFRHCRLTDLATNYGFSDIQLQHFVGWKTSSMAAKYTHLDDTAIIKAMIMGSQMKNKDQTS